MRVCKRGHKLTPENTHTDKNGDQYCRRCHRAANRRRAQTRQAHSTSAVCTALLDKLRVHEEWRDKTPFVASGTPGSRSGVIETLIRRECTRLGITVTREDVEVVRQRGKAKQPEPFNRTDPVGDLKALAEAFGPRFSG